MSEAALPDLLQKGEVLHLQARISHVRTGAKRHAFRYKADYLLFAPEVMQHSRGVLRRNGFGLFSLMDRDHGGGATRKTGQGAAWVWARFAEVGLPIGPDCVLGLLTQPRWLGLSFNPVSFWILWREGEMLAYLAEVNNTFGQRHSYLCRPDQAAGRPQIAKVFHVSPFQDLGGSYEFRLDIEREGVDLLITYRGPGSGLVARMQGALRPLSQLALLKVAFTRPGGSIRILGLICFEALRLKLRGATYRPLPPPPNQEISE